MKTFLGSLGSNPSLDIFRAELLAIGDIQPQLSYFIQDTTKNFSFCNKNIKSGKAWFLERVNSRKDLATTHLLFALDRCVTFPLRTLRSCGTLLQESFMLHMTWSLQTEEQALSRSGGEAQAEEQQIQGPWTRADLAHVREVAGRPVWLEWREQWDSSGDQWGGRCERFSKCRAEPTFSKCRFSEKDLGFSLTSENTERFWTVEKHDLTNFMRSLCCPLKQRVLERRKQGEWLGGCCNHPGEGAWWLGWETRGVTVEMMRSGPGLGTLRRGASRCAAGCDWGCERMRGVQHLWPETWKDGAALAETRETLRVVG